VASFDSYNANHIGLRLGRLAGQIWEAGSTSKARLRNDIPSLEYDGKFYGFHTQDNIYLLSFYVSIIHILREKPKRALAIIDNQFNTHSILGLYHVFGHRGPENGMVWPHTG